ncbi:MAG: sugar phosphate isomerase/epimerase [Planctomycetota bacterium]|nr:sugar phosphate isomerase/epimerase [Planctomycetota bacterium]MDA0932224.1 sugar phosphate isomerase/epimerase [Planctomycetota bacterium]
MLPHPIDRRSFLSLSTAASVAACAAPSTVLVPPAPEPKAGPLFEISLAQWSLHKALRGSAGEKIDNLDFPGTARELGFGAVEYVNQFFKDKARDEAYLKQLAQRCEDAGVRSLLIMCDGEGRLGDPDAKRRQQAVENHHRWVEAAKFLGCHSIRVNAASAGSYDEQQKLAADGLASLTDFAAGHGIHVIVENHGGLSSNGKWLAGVMRLVDHPGCGTLPDFGNFRVGPRTVYDRYVGVAELMPYAKAVSAKSHDFDEQGNEIHTDYRRMLGIVLAARYTGYVGVEYEGSKLSEIDGILATRRLLERVRDEMC